MGIKIEQVFKDNIDNYQKELVEIRKSYGSIANIRMVVVLIGIYTTYQWVVLGKLNLWAILSIGIYCGFMVLMRKHQKLKEKMDRFEALIRVNEKYIKRLTQEWQGFEEDGADVLDPNHPYAFDLDIVGPRSIYQKINATHTWFGKQKLVQALLQPDYSHEEIEERQKAIGELMHNLDFCQRIEGVKQEKIASPPDRMIQYATAETGTFTKPWWKYYAKIMGIITLLLLTISIVFDQEIVGMIASILLVGNLMLQYLYILKISEAKGMLSSLVYDLNAYSQILETIEQQEFYSTYLKEQKDILYEGGHSAKDGIRQLEHLCNKANISYQPIAAIILNATWVWDMKVMVELEEWKKNYGMYMESYLQAIGEIESLVSLAVLGHVEKEVCFPLIEEEGKIIEGVQIGHPLIAPMGRISNDVEMKENIFIITGSNMSGKTTFLRTIGVQLVLAYAGAPVPAKKLRCSRMKLYTSMRIRDDLSEGISTFYAELTRIKSIVEAAKKGETICFLIDEIFRGTNSVDRIIGAKSVIKGLQKQGAIGAMTTHDLEICHLAEGDQIMNYHFTESYSEDQIQFDYLLKEGASTTTNAKYLMKMVGIEIIEA